jgi:hypothetical protein
MPKEITHWQIAAQVAEGLKGGAIGDAAAANSNCLMLGAVFHDILFYLRGPGQTLPFLTLADELHGIRGEDTYEIIRNLTSAIMTSKRPGPLMAFMTGLVSHIHTDFLFHPMVFYLTGNYFDPDPAKRTKAVQRHRRIEAMIDLLFCGNPGELKKYSLKGFLKKAEVSVADLFAEALGGFARQKGLPNLFRALDRALKIFVFMQKISRNQVLSYAVYSFQRILPNSFKEITSLFYAPQINAELLKISGVISYRHPATGRVSEHSVQNIFDMAVEESVAFCRKIEPSIVNNTPMQLNERGPSLEVGLKSVPVEEVSHFAVRPLI